MTVLPLLRVKHKRRGPVLYVQSKLRKKNSLIITTITVVIIVCRVLKVIARNTRVVRLIFYTRKAVAEEERPPLIENMLDLKKKNLGKKIRKKLFEKIIIKPSG